MNPVAGMAAGSSRHRGLDLPLGIQLLSALILWMSSLSCSYSASFSSRHTEQGHPQRCSPVVSLALALGT